MRAIVCRLPALMGAVLLLGVVIGWILGSRAAADAYASQMRKQQRTKDGPRPKA